MSVLPTLRSEQPLPDTSAFTRSNFPDRDFRLGTNESLLSAVSCDKSDLRVSSTHVVLTATDTHYLVGLLTRVSEGTDVEIELGDLVFDSAADKDRDIDVTATRRDRTGRITAFKGIEVKNETRPLDVVHVEQLCIKFADMSEVTDKAIVSASGYTDAATKKARAHGVEPYEIVDWNDPSKGFSIRFPEGGFILTEQYYQWVEYGVQLSVGVEYSPALDEELKTNPLVCDSTGAPLPEVADYHALGAR